MKAVILAAGKSTRLGEIGKQMPKPLLDVGGRTPLQRHIENCAKHGFRQLLINTHHLPDQIRKFCGDGSAWGVDIVFSYEPVLLGTAGALDNFRIQLGGETFLVIYGDNLVEPDLGAILETHRCSSAEATVAVHWREDVSTSGMVETGDSCRITGFIEKPPKHLQSSHLVNAGIYCLEPSVLSRIPCQKEYDFGRDVFPAMLAGGCRLVAHKIAEELRPLDTPELLENARAGK